MELNHQNKLFSINFFDAIITVFVALALPLLLLERNIDVSTIGIIFSLLPIFYTASRLFCASIADQSGFKKFYVLNGIGNFFHALVFLIANNPMLYAFGKILEGGKTAFIWAVNRSSIIVESGHALAYRGNSKIAASRVFGAAIASVLVGLIIVNFSFDAVFLLSMILSIAILLISFSMKKDGKFRNVRVFETLKRLDFRNKSLLFKKTAFAMIFQTFAVATMLAFVLPIYLKQSGFGFEMIGFIFGAYYLTDALTISFALKKNLSTKSMLLLQGLLFCIGMLLAPFFGGTMLILFLLIASIGDSLGGIIWEMLIANAVKKSKSISVDIGWIHVPSHIGNAIGIFAAGFMIESIGYIPVFVMCAISFALYTILSADILLKKID